VDDPEPTEVLDAYDRVTLPREQRQSLFGNALYTNMTRSDFFGFARGALQNPIFREYWYATCPHRATLISASDEA